MENEQNQNQDNTSRDLNTLESQTTIIEDTPPSETPSTPSISQSTPDKPKRIRPPLPRLIAEKFNIYMLLFILLVIVAGVVTIYSFLKNNDAKNDGLQQFSTEPLSEEQLAQLRQTDVKVGDPKRILSVESNAVFAGKVLIRDSLEVAGEIRSGGNLSVPGLTVSGNTLLAQVQASTLQVSGNTTLQGQLAVQNGLTVNGNGSFSGALTASRLNIQDLQINGDLQFNRHIDAGGATPGKTDGGALGSGGTSSVSGTDTAGTININTGGSPGAGCFVTINFAQRYNGTPHVVITPVSPAAAGLNYYINRSSANFSVCTTNSAPASQNFAFDYIVID